MQRLCPPPQRIAAALVAARSGITGIGVALGAVLAAAAGCETAQSPTRLESITVNGGTFVMGSLIACTDVTGPQCAGDRTPHKVRVSPFKMDNIEVSKRLYAACVRSGGCTATGAYYAPEDDTPVLVDDPEAARRYCASRNLRLPTEAEFEFASRVGASGSQLNYSWGDQPPTCGRLPMKGCTEKRPRPVGTSPGDLNLLGIYDLSGSVPEWVEDDYSPYIGCADRMSYGELCWGKSAGCAKSRCGNDGPDCSLGCLPASAAAANPGGGADDPVCPAAPGAALQIDPVVRGAYPFHVLRGGGPSDGACAFAGFTRRLAAPKSYAAGFRCAASVDQRPRTGITTYRLAVDGCPPGGRIRVAIRIGGQAGGYTLDWFATNAPGVKSITADKGIVDDLPCDAVMVVYPAAATALEVRVNTVGGAKCLGGSAAPALNVGTDTPLQGLEAVKLAPANDC